MKRDATAPEVFCPVCKQACTVSNDEIVAGDLGDYRRINYECMNDDCGDVFGITIEYGLDDVAAAGLQPSSEAAFELTPKQKITSADYSYDNRGMDETWLREIDGDGIIVVDPVDLFKNAVENALPSDHPMYDTLMSRIDNIVELIDQEQSKEG